MTAIPSSAQVPVVSPWRRTLQWLLLAATLPVLAIMFWWPAWLMPEGEVLAHGVMSLLMVGQCLALTAGCGLFQRSPQTVWAAAMGLGAAALMATLTLRWWG